MECSAAGPRPYVHQQAGMQTWAPTPGFGCSLTTPPPFKWLRGEWCWPPNQQPEFHLCGGRRQRTPSSQVTCTSNPWHTFSPHTKIKVLKEDLLTGHHWKTNNNHHWVVVTPISSAVCQSSTPAHIPISNTITYLFSTQDEPIINMCVIV